MKTLMFALFSVLCACQLSYGQAKIVTTGNNLVSPSDPYAADVVIGSDANGGARHDASIMFWSSGSASRIWNTGDVFYFSQWLTTNPNVALNAGIGGNSYMQGGLSLGTTTMPSGYKLAVNGSVIATSVKISLYNNWPDYVFRPTYKLQPLSQLKSFIALNHHLPDVPSASAVEREGLDVAEIQKVLLKKIEELTLYILEEHKANQKLKKQMAELTKKVSSTKIR